MTGTISDDELPQAHWHRLVERLNARTTEDAATDNIGRNITAAWRSQQGRRRPISPEARRSVLHIEDPDDARDLALDYDDERRGG